MHTTRYAQIMAADIQLQMSATKTEHKQCLQCIGGVHTHTYCMQGHSEGTGKCRQIALGPESERGPQKVWSQTANY